LEIAGHFNPKTAKIAPAPILLAAISSTVVAISASQTLICVIAPGPAVCEGSRDMKSVLFSALMLSLALLAGCGKQDATAGAAAPATPSGNVLEITANDAMKFNVTRFEAAAGADLKVILTNLGNMPKAAMGHNWVLLKKGTDAKAFVDAAAVATTTDYIPAAMADAVIAHTKMLGPKQTDEITFKVPTEPGEYVFVCSFPAHYFSGMHGVLVVK
jgi:azurin